MNTSFTNTYVSSAQPTVPTDNRAGYSHTLSNPVTIVSENGVTIKLIGYSYLTTPKRGITITLQVVNNTQYDLSFFLSDAVIDYTSDSNGLPGSEAANDDYYGGVEEKVEAGQTGIIYYTLIAQHGAVFNSATSMDGTIGIYAPAGTRLAGNKNYFTKSFSNVPIWGD